MDENEKELIYHNSESSYNSTYILEKIIILLS
jgi:hypothetical protein